MKNAKWLYDIDSSNSYRYSLGYFTEKPLLCVGVNPSTATPDKLDNTIRSVARIASANKYDGWIMRLCEKISVNRGFYDKMR